MAATMMHSRAVGLGGRCRGGARSVKQGPVVRGVSRVRGVSHVARAASQGRTIWLPNTQPPKYLDGSLPADFGFDPLGLGADSERLKWYVEAEKTNGRWAMMAVLGIMGTEVLGVQPRWFEAGGKEYWMTNNSLIATEATIMGFFETKRYIGFKKTGKSGVVDRFPFDPLKLDSPTNAVKEVKNGRLAMVAFVGFVTQALATRMGPLEGLQKHIADPVHRNITYYLTHLPETLSSYGA